MVDVDTPPIRRVVAGGTLLGIVIGGGIRSVAIQAVYQIGMNHKHFLPI